MIILFKVKDREIGQLTWNGKSIDVSNNFPKELLKNLKDGIEPRNISEKNEIVYGPKVYFSDGIKFLRALPTNFFNYYLNARIL